MTHKTQYAFKRIEVSGYKSIQDVVIEDIAPLMVLAGSNGAGKSNFVDTFEILNELMTENVKKVTENRNVETITFLLEKYKLKYNIKIDRHLIDFEELEYLTNNKTYVYPNCILEKTINNLNEEKNKFDQWGVKIEQLLDSDHMEDLSLAIKEMKNVINNLNKLNFYAGTIKNLETKQISFTQIYESELKENKSISELLSQLSNIQIFRIDPIQAKKPSIDDANSLKSDGSNIASVLANLENDDEFRETILDWLSLIVPEMKNIKVNNRHIDSSKMLEFAEESGKKFPAHLVSDGTIYALCMLVAILTRTQKAGITIIEEPERGLHPKAIGELIGFMREHASINHPIILTTHSESVVRELELDELFFVSKENGKTKIKSVKNSAVDKNKIPLDTAWLTNVLDGGLPW